MATLIQAKGQLLTHRKLLHAVWGADAVDQTHYLRIYMGKLRAKIEQSAFASRRSMSAEVVIRLEASYAQDKAATIEPMDAMEQLYVATEIAQ